MERGGGAPPLRRPYLPCISLVSPLYLPLVRRATTAPPISPLHLPCISPIPPPDQARDHCAVLPSVLRLLHRTLSDYHAAFADKLSLPLEVLRLLVLTPRP